MFVSDERTGHDVNKKHSSYENNFLFLLILAETFHFCVLLNVPVGIIAI